MPARMLSSRSQKSLPTLDTACIREHRGKHSFVNFLLLTFRRAVAIGGAPLQMFTFGVDRGTLDATPSISMPRPGGTENSRKRELSEPEVRRFWRRLTRTRLSFEVRTALKLILVTAQRPGEVALAAREVFDLERRVCTIPPERSKNGQPHEVPLNDLAMLLLKRLRRHFGETQYILPSRCWRVRGAAAITVRALPKACDTTTPVSAWRS